MGAVIIEHVDVADLPAPHAARVAVRIEEQDATQTVAEEANSAVDLRFGVWRGREDTADVEGDVRKLRAPRCNPGGSRNQS